jgi:hypothetical protein
MRSPSIFGTTAAAPLAASDSFTALDGALASMHLCHHTAIHHHAVMKMRMKERSARRDNDNWRLCKDETKTDHAPGGNHRTLCNVRLRRLLYLRWWVRRKYDHSHHTVCPSSFGRLGSGTLLGRLLHAKPQPSHVDIRDLQVHAVWQRLHVHGRRGQLTVFPSLSKPTGQ